MEEVMNPEDANFSIVISESCGLKRVLEKIYFYLEKPEDARLALRWVADNYGYLIFSNTRIDCYKVIFGRKVARG